MTTPDTAARSAGRYAAWKNPTWHFAALTWRSMLNDLLGHREIAIESYKQALALGGNPTIRHARFGLTLDRTWVQQRLQTLFTRPLWKG